MYIFQGDCVTLSLFKLNIVLTATKHDIFPGPKITTEYPILREVLERMFN